MHGHTNVKNEFYSSVLQRITRVCICVCVLQPILAVI